MLKSVVRTVGAALRLPAASSSTARALPLRCPQLCAPNAATARPFTRSLWMMNGNGASGDKSFGEFLLDEIKEEKKIQKSATLPKISGGWELSTEGAQAELTKHVAGEKITVTFNVNDSILPNFADEADKGEQKSGEEDEIVSTPNFVVEITKKAAKNSLVIDCQFLQDELAHGEGEESDIFGIVEVSFQPEGDTEMEETSYILTKDSLNDDLYDHMMDYLADRGVDNTFADELIELSTALEHQEYINFLGELKTFVKCN
ncbi:complement component 1 Q subcomponent-binding protein, mitochondrial [Corythoichthys intestinalis]|uniref:complement component 1 Q subcomponent-binding protein, mitochondrial n=1 Tax=Corythoichthys intestinalis TaxID=161448 RepID=UPI0025A5F104|nr:complement component 1 Q subcomponent-binding protein, mitochondrial [Corythoichthys intestinalis]